MALGVTSSMTRYFISQSGEWYRLSPNGVWHTLRTDGVVKAFDAFTLDLNNLIEASVLKETTKEKWIQACRWFRKFPGSFIND